MVCLKHYQFFSLLLEEALAFFLHLTRAVFSRQAFRQALAFDPLDEKFYHQAQAFKTLVEMPNCQLIIHFLQVYKINFCEMGKVILRFPRFHLARIETSRLTCYRRFDSRLTCYQCFDSRSRIMGFNFSKS